MTLVQVLQISTPKGLAGEVFVRPTLFEAGGAEALEEVVIGFGFGGDERRLNITSPGEKGVQADVVLKPRGASYDLSGSLRWPLALADVAKTAENTPLISGDVVVQGEFKSTGRGPAAAAAALEGKGNYWLSNAKFSRLTLDGFGTAALNATTPAALTSALAQLDRGAGTAIGQRIGNFTVLNGQVVVSPIPVKAESVDAVIAPQFDFASGVLRVATAIGLTARPDLPQVTITYEGSRGGLSTRNGTSALAAKLGYALLSKEMAELERLQQEQQALLAKEEAQRVEDEKRFADYQNTRAELREQARVRRFHVNQRVAREARLGAIVDGALKTSAAQSRLDLQRHARRLAVRRAGRI